LFSTTFGGSASAPQALTGAGASDYTAPHGSDEATGTYLGSCVLAEELFYGLEV